MLKPKRDKSIIRESEFSDYKRGKYPVSLSAGTYLTPIPTIKAVLKWRQFPPPAVAESPRDYVAEFERLNNLTSPPVQWVQCTHELIDAYIERAADERRAA